MGDAPDETHIQVRVRWWYGWGLLLAVPWSVMLLPSTTPRWVVMWTLAFAIFVGCRWLTWRRTPAPLTPLWRHLAYLFGWPGLDAVAFLRGGPTVSRPTIREWGFALSKFVVGLMLMFGVARLVPEAYPYVVGWVGMIGIVMTLHFGLFHLLSCGWRAWGIDARPLMNWPLTAVGVGEFWGRRWNTAFRDLTYRFLFRPVTRRIGPTVALLVGFAFSGLVHDLVISLPAGGGYGGPTLFFLIQGLAVFVERSRIGKRLGLGSGWRGWAFTAGSMLATVGLLLHAPFVVGVVVPFLAALGAIG